MAYHVVMTIEARKDFDSLPVTIRARAAQVFERLEDWPEVSGAKPLRGRLKGHYRIRTGDWRVMFRVVERLVVVEVIRIANRRDVYKE